MEGMAAVTVRSARSSRPAWWDSEPVFVGQLRKSSGVTVSAQGNCTPLPTGSRYINCNVLRERRDARRVPRRNCRQPLRSSDRLEVCITTHSSQVRQGVCNRPWYRPARAVDCSSGSCYGNPWTAQGQAVYCADGNAGKSFASWTYPGCCASGSGSSSDSGSSASRQMAGPEGPQW